MSQKFQYLIKLRLFDDRINYYVHVAVAALL